MRDGFRQRFRSARNKRARPARLLLSPGRSRPARACPTIAFHGGCCTNPRRAPYIRSKGELRNSEFVVAHRLAASGGAPLRRARTHLRERAAPFPKQLCAIASMRSDSGLSRLRPPSWTTRGGIGTASGGPKWTDPLLRKRRVRVCANLCHRDVPAVGKLFLGPRRASLRTAAVAVELPARSFEREALARRQEPLANGPSSPRAPARPPRSEAAARAPASRR